MKKLMKLVIKEDGCTIAKGAGDFDDLDKMWKELKRKMR